MGSLSIWHLLILGAVVLLLFGGKGKISDIMGDFAKGIKSFKKGLADDDAPATPTASLDHRQAVEANPVSQSQKIN
jgi:sec-independent protein translocase protein TatA